MPIYPYHCENCGKDIEVEQRITAEPLRTCEACGQQTLVRQIAGTSFVLKGNRWFKDGYSNHSVKCDDCKGRDK